MEKLKQNVVAWLMLAAFVGFAIGMTIGEQQGYKRLGECRDEMRKCANDNADLRYRVSHCE